MTGSFFWHELNTLDLERSAAFHASVLDLDAIQDAATGAFALAHRGSNTPLLGLSPMMPSDDAVSHWIGYLAVPDLDAALALTDDHGGLTHVHSDDLDPAAAEQGRFAVITDPTGAVVLLREGTPSTASLPAALPQAGDVAWIELLTSDRAAAAAFYTALLGWEFGPEHPRADEGSAQAVFAHGRQIGLMRDLQAGSPIPPFWSFYHCVQDLTRAIAYARQLGGFAYEDPADVDGGRRVLMLDPTGAPTGFWAPHVA